MSFLTERSAPLLRWQSLLSLPVAGIIIGLIGPFGSYVGMTVLERIGHFVLCVTLIGGCSLIVSYDIARRFFQGYWPLWAGLCVDLALVLPGAAVVYGSLSLFAPDVVANVGPASLIWQNLLMTLIFRVISLALSWQRIREGGHVETKPEVAEEAPAFHARLPRGLRSQPILALSSEDHYLRVHTPKGEALILMTMAEAVAMLPHGFQIHRSHWVADTAIKEARSDKVELVTGLSLPLSRHRRKAFDEWLDALAVRPA
ncbi:MULTISPECIES: LytTR family DNA-binding domain-containing protein [Asticcacaulis]|uniref:LytTR family DNA-binding domain-containing protein n=1 Tax=Asticcacaulis TaxID=76890 RepID=UPI001AE927A2|nr:MULTISPECIES: LytTR family DNA-binding domain-containing protein [Asticcacaulis]MBP2160160.1 hypothetical protein [Asticcacaulis solisilvae]MDR6801205.1 hypothetical protein [Asticcacaulis sp. BE141]